MAAKSKHWLDVRTWIIDMIKSSEEGNLKHYLTIDKLIRNYRDLYMFTEMQKQFKFRFMIA
jgi:hypothetical protein